MWSLIIYFLPVILALGIITSHEDAKEGKIRNKYLVSAAAIGILIHCILISTRLESVGQAKTQALITIVALVTGMVIWHLKWWSGGDAKLFATYALIFPAAAMNNTSVVFHVMILFAAMVVPIWIVLFARAIITRPAKILNALKNAIRPKEILSSLLLILSVPWLLTLGLALIGVQSNFLLNMAAIIIIGSLADKYIPKKIKLAAYGLVVLTRAVLATSSLLSLKVLISSALMLIIYMIARYSAMTLMLNKMAATQKTKNIKKQGWRGFWSTYTSAEMPFAPIMLFGVLLTTILAILNVI